MMKVKLLIAATGFMWAAWFNMGWAGYLFWGVLCLGLLIPDEYIG